MQPPELDAVLADRHYERYNETLVQTADLSGLSPIQDTRFNSSDTVSDEWLSAWGTWNGVRVEHIATAKEMLMQTKAPSCFAWIEDKAVGLGVYEDGYIVETPEIEVIGLKNNHLQKTKVKNKDHRVFLDGIYSYNKEKGIEK